MKEKNRLVRLLLILAFLIPAQAFTQDSGSGPQGFRDLRLGMSIEEVKNSLLVDPLFQFLPGRPGDTDGVSLQLPAEARCRLPKPLSRSRVVRGECF